MASISEISSFLISGDMPHHTAHQLPKFHELLEKRHIHNWSICRWAIITYMPFLFRKIRDSCSYILKDNSENTKRGLLTSGMGECLLVCISAIYVYLIYLDFKIFCLVPEHLQFIWAIGTESFMGLTSLFHLGTTCPTGLYI